LLLENGSAKEAGTQLNIANSAFMNQRCTNGGTVALLVYGFDVGVINIVKQFRIVFPLCSVDSDVKIRVGAYYV